jgi:hypothetical protein
MISMSNHRLSNISHRYTSWSFSSFCASVGMAVKNNVGLSIIDGLGQIITSEEGINLLPLTDESLMSWRIM